MPLVYDQPTVQPAAGGMTPAAMPEQKNYNADQMMQQGQSLVKAGLAITYIQNHIDDAQAKAADNFMTQGITDIMVSGDDPYLATVGQDAVTRRPDVEQKLADLKNQTMEKFGQTSVQKALIEQYSGVRMRQASAQVGAHVIEGAKTYNLQATQERASTSAKAAIANWATYGKEGSPFDTNLVLAQQAARDVVKQQYGESASAELQDAAALKVTTGIHTNVISQMLTAQRTDDAQKYFKTYQNQIDPAQWTDISKWLSQSSADNEGIQLAMSQMAAGKTLEEGIKAGYTALGGGTASFKPDSFKAFQAEYESLWERKQQSDARATDDLAAPIYQAILNRWSTGGDMLPSELRSLPAYQQLAMSNNPLAVQAALKAYDTVFTRHHQLQVEARAESNASKAQDDAALSQRWFQWQTNPQALEVLAGMSDAQVQAEAVSLGKNYGQQFLNLRKSVTSPEKLADVKMQSTEFKGMMTILGVSKKDQPEVFEAGKQYVVREQQQRGRVLNADEIRACFGAGLSQVQVRGRSSFMGLDMGSTTITKPLYQVENEANIVIPDQITLRNGTVTTIPAILKAQGIEDTPRNRAKVYKAYLTDQSSTKMRGVK